MRSKILFFINLTFAVVILTFLTSGFNGGELLLLVPFTMPFWGLLQLGLAIDGAFKAPQWPAWIRALIFLYWGVTILLFILFLVMQTSHSDSGRAFALMVFGPWFPALINLIIHGGIAFGKKRQPTSKPQTWGMVSRTWYSVNVGFVAVVLGAGLLLFAGVFVAVPVAMIAWGALQFILGMQALYLWPRLSTHVKAFVALYWVLTSIVLLLMVMMYTGYVPTGWGWMIPIVFPWIPALINLYIHHQVSRNWEEWNNND